MDERKQQNNQGVAVERFGEMEGEYRRRERSVKDKTLAGFFDQDSIFIWY